MIRSGRVAGGVASAIVVALASAVVVSGLGSAGAASTQLDLSTGTAWFSSPASGLVTSIDGPTVTRVAVTEAAPPGHDISVVQAGNDALVVDRTDGTIRKLSGATLTAGDPVAVAPAGDASLTVHADEDSIWVVTQGGSIVQQYDPVTTAPVGPAMPFPGTATSSALTTDGTLWLEDSSSGLVRSFGDAEVRGTRELDVSASSSLVAVGSEVAVVDPVAAKIDVLDRDLATDRTSCLDVAPGAAVLAAGSARLVAGVVADTSTLHLADTERGTCRPLALDVAGGSELDRFGRPVVRGERVFVADRQLGGVIVVEPSLDGGTDEIIARIGLGLAGHDLTLFVHHDFVWFDDDTSGVAGVIRDDLTALVVEKTAGDGQPTPPPDQTLPSGEDTPTVTCRATPSSAQIGQTVVFDGVAEPPDATVQSWQWSLDGAVPPTGTGPQVQATFATAGTHAVSLEAVVELGGTIRTLHDDCPVVVGDQAASTTTAPPDTALPETPATPPPTTTPRAETSTSGSSTGTTDGPAPTPAPTPPPPDTDPPTGTTDPTDTEPPPTDPTTTSSSSSTTTTSSSSTTTTTVPAPDPDFSWDPPLPQAGETVTFTDLTVGTHDSVEWTFEGGEPAESTDAAPTVTWAAPGTYMVTLTASNGDSGNSFSKPVTVVADPLAGTWLGPTTGRLEITRRADDQLDVHVYGDCTPTACDVGVQLGTVAPAGNGFTMEYDDGVAQRTVTAFLSDADTLTTAWRSVYPPTDSRGIKCWTTVYHRSGSGSTTTNASCDAEKFVGAWRESGTGRLEIAVRTDGALDVHVYGDCVPTACDVGVQRGEMSSDGSGFTLDYETTVAHRSVTATYVDADTLLTYWRSVYPPGDSRGIKCWTTTYRRSTQGSTDVSASCDGDKFAGTWRAEGTGKLEISVRSDGALDVHVFGDCVPTACDVGVQRGTLTSDGSGFTMNYDDRVAHRTVTATFIDSDTLSSTWRSVYPPGDSRGVRCWITTFRRGSAGSTSTFSC